MPVTFRVSDVIRSKQPTFNPLVARGIAVAQMDQVETFMDNVFKTTATAFGDGLTYEGYKRCTPEEEVREILRQQSSRTIELSRSNTYLVNFKLKYGEEEIIKSLYLPYVNQAGQIYIRDTLQTILPILADGGLSVSKGTIFVAFLKTKVIFMREPYSFLRDGEVVTNYYVHGNIHKQKLSNIPHYNLKKDDSVHMEHALTLYLLSKYGFKGVMEKYFPGVEYHLMRKEDYDVGKFPRDTYTLLESCRVQSKRIKYYYLDNELVVVIKHKDYDARMETMMTGFFYVSDHYANRLTDPSWLDDTMTWRAILGHAILRTTEGIGTLLEEANKHIASVDYYLDDFLRWSLREEGIFVNDIYDLFQYLQENFTKVLFSTDVGSMYGKKPTVLRYVMSDIITGINNFTFSIQNTKGKRKEMKVGDMKRELGIKVQFDAIYRITNKHPEVTTVQSAGDCYIFSYTSRILQQEKATSTKRKKGPFVSNDPINWFHPSILEIGSVLNLPKSEPTGRMHLNMFLQGYRLNGCFKSTERWKPIIDRVAKMTTRT